MSSYMIPLLVIFAACCTAFYISGCNVTTVDEDDPITLELAKLDAIRCQIEASRQQHLETLAAITGIKNMIPRPTNMYDVLLYCFSSIFIVTLFSQALRCVYYYTLIRSDRIASVLWLVKQCPTTDIRSPSPAELAEFRIHLSKPVLAYCMCCLGRTVGRMDEMI
jgi:hypothetical protein